MNRLDEALRGRPPLSLLSQGVESLRANLDQRASALADSDVLRGHAEANRELELILTRTQSLFMPWIRGSFGYRFFNANGEIEPLDAAQWIREERQRFDFALAAEECDLDPAAIASHHDRLLDRAERIDPTKAWQTLIQQVDRRRVEELRGLALRARDFRDAGNVLRFWHHALERSGDLLDDYIESRTFGPPRSEVNVRRYGFAELEGNRAAQPAILEEFGLYPWRVALITEGESEIRMLDTILQHQVGRSLQELGIVPVDMRGAGMPGRKNDRTRFKNLLAALRRFPNYFFLVFDDEGEATKLIAELEKHKTDYAPFEGVTVLEPAPRRTTPAAPEGWTGDNYVPLRNPERVIWDNDLEADNFTVEETCTVIRDMAAEDPEILDFTLDPRDLALAAENSEKALGTVAVALAQQRGFPGLRKPDLAAKLGEYALEHPLRAGTRRRILIVAEHLWRLSGAHRQLRGRLRES